ncbi:hypothetical protein L1987_87671 [Smallanthus sonchifolius]|nr:hypothetical protein L1987_87671 [Smallanthus sonchifolius]
MGEQHKINKPPHVLLFPFPAQGHINPLSQFGKRLLSKGVETTLVTTIYILNSTLSHNNNTSIEIEAISDGFDEGGFASADSPESYLKTFKEVGSKSLVDIIHKLQSEGKTIDAIIYDSFIPWALDVAMEFGIDGATFFTQACAVNSIYYHVHKGLISLPPDSTVSVPGLPQLERWETPSFVHKCGTYPGWSEMVFNQFANIDEARWVFASTFYQLEEQVMKSRLTWCNILRVDEKDVEVKGLVVAWCRQLDVLAHESIGCFVTHCGLNSALEAISLGVPVVGMPQWTDQTTNAKLLDDVWGVGVRIKADENGIVRRGNLASCIKKIMEEERGVLARRNVKKWRELAKVAVDEGGSSDKDIDDFVCELEHYA